MLPFKKVIFPIDYSNSCDATVPFVKELVQHFSASLTLLHAYNEPVAAYGELALSVPTFSEDGPRLEQERMQKFATEKFGGCAVQAAVQMGDAASLVHDLIRQETTDLVMLPTHGQGLIRRLLLGSVTAKVLHDTSAAVWTATPQALKAFRPPYKSILCTCDVNSPEAEAILRAAVFMAAKYGANLHVLHIMGLTPFVMEADYAGLRVALVDAANVMLERLKKAAGTDAPHRIAEGAISTAVREEAARTHADLIVTGRGHDQDTVGRLWSSLYEIVRESPCPVLSI